MLSRNNRILLARILHGEFRHGEKLPTEVSLCQEFKASKPIIRKALSKLKQEGYLSSVRGSGYYLQLEQDPTFSKFEPIQSHDEIIQCMQYRYVLEGQTAYEAALYANSMDKQFLITSYEETLVDDTNRTRQKDMELDMKFHLAIAKVSHNRFFYQALKILSIQMSESILMVISQYTKDKARLFKIKDEAHKDILDGILAGKAEYAKASMQYHILHSKYSLEN